MRTKIWAAIAAALAAGVVGLMSISSAATSKVVADMTGGQEVPEQGDPDGGGRAVFKIDPGAGSARRVCFNLSWRDILPPTAAHIHEGTRGNAGDPVVTLFATTSEALPDTISAVKGCVPGVERALARSIAERPQRFYVNVHNEKFPAGAIRGQLEEAR